MTLLSYRSVARLLTLTLAFPILALARDADKPATGPWDVPALLASAPPATWGEAKGKDLVRDLTYEGVPLNGKPTRVFAYYARPATGDGPFPAMLLVHGGGGKAFREWAELWAKRGYVALAMDLAGHGPDGKRLSDGGPDQDDGTKFRDFTPDQARNAWTYHAVADVLRGHALLAAQKEVDADRIGITGISWGGYLTCIVAGIDDRLKVAVPVYGCGFLHENSYWLPQFGRMTPDQRDRWVSLFDPSRYLTSVRCPTLFVNGTNDFAYPLDSYQKSYRLVTKAPRTLCVTVRMPHGHSEGWNPNEIALFTDSILRKGAPLASVGELTLRDGQAMAKVHSEASIVSAALHYTTDTGPWDKREWKTTEATYQDGTISAKLPPSPSVVFLSVTDNRGAIVSTEHAETR